MFDKFPLKCMVRLHDILGFLKQKSRIGGNLKAEGDRIGYVWRKQSELPALDHNLLCGTLCSNDQTSQRLKVK